MWNKTKITLQEAKNAGNSKKVLRLITENRTENYLKKILDIWLDLCQSYKYLTFVQTNYRITFVYKYILRILCGNTWSLICSKEYVVEEE